jgi:hypothetical protein
MGWWSGLVDRGSVCVRVVVREVNSLKQWLMNHIQRYTLWGSCGAVGLGGV